MRAGRASALPALLLLVSACEPAETDPGPGGVTVGEARALDDAASMLDEQRLPPDALREVTPEGTESQAPDLEAPGL